MFTVVSRRPAGSLYGPPPARAVPYLPPRLPRVERRIVTVRVRRCSTRPGALLCAAAEWCTGGRGIRIYRGWPADVVAGGSTRR